MMLRDDPHRPLQTRARRLELWPTVWLAIALIAVKATYVTLSVFWEGTTARDYVSWLFLKWLAGASRADLLFALGSGFAANLAIRILARWRLARVTSHLFVLFGFACVLYAIVSRQVFAYYGASLTYQLLALGGEPSTLASSVAAHVTGPVALALAGGPVGFSLLSWATLGRQQGSKRQGAMVLQAGAVAAIVGWLTLGSQMLGTGWFAAQDRYLAESPHWMLLQSAVLAISGARPSLGSLPMRDEDLRDFQPVTESTAVTRGKAQERMLGGHRPRNVVLIVLESVGTKYLGIYGSHLDTTPRLAAEAKNSITFDAYYAPVGWTAYSLTSLTLSHRPLMKRYNTTSFRLPELQGETIATVLRNREYRTAFMAAADPDWASPNFFDGKGFETVRGSTDFAGTERISSWGIEDSVLFDQAIDWIGRHQREPFFLMMWTGQTHHPYVLGPGEAPFPAFVSAGIKPDLSRYLTLVRNADAQVGRVFDALRAQGLANDTLVVVTGDHGEAFGDPHRTSGHGFTVYDEEVRVPLVLWNPRLIAGGKRSLVVGSHLDLAPTVVDLLGLRAPSGWQGRSLLSPDRPPRAYLFAAAWGQYLLGIREERWKYIADLRHGSEELYDLSVDPEERHNVASEHPDRSRRLRERLGAWLHVERDP